MSADWHTLPSLTVLDTAGDRNGPDQAGVSQRLRRMDTTTTGPTGTPQPDHLCGEQGVSGPGLLDRGAVTNRQGLLIGGPYRDGSIEHIRHKVRRPSLHNSHPPNGCLAGATRDSS